MVEPLPSKPSFDETDLELIELIENDYDVSLQTIADELDVSKSAVHYRLNKFKDEGVIQSVTADINPRAFGLEMVAITDVSVSHASGYSENIGEKLSDLQGVEQVFYTMGDVDFVAISRVQSRNQLNDLIERIVSIDGVNETSSSFVIQEFHKCDGVVANLTEEARANILEETDE